MKRYFRLTVLLLTLLVALSVNAFAERNIPKSVRPNGPYQVDSKGNIINWSAYLNLTLERAEYVKVASAKGMIYNISNVHWSTSKYSTSSSASMSVSGSKEGTFTIKLDIYDASTNKKKTSATVTVFAYGDGPCQLLVNGKKYDYKPIKSSTANVKVKMNKGYTLKKLEYGAYGKPTTKTEKDGNYTYKTRQNELIYKTFKNGAKIKLGIYKPVTYTRTTLYNDPTGDNSYKEYEYRTVPQAVPTNSYKYAPTVIRVTYIDKYSKEEKTTSFTIYKQK